MNKLLLPLYNLEQTLLGGQSFAWERINDIYYGVTRAGVIALKLEGDYIYWQTYPEKDNFELINKYLRLNIDYPKVLLAIAKDEHISKAVETYPGLRLLQQDFEETLLSFILASVKNIPAIKDSLRKLRSMYGEKLIVDNNEFYLFPEIDVLANADINDLLKTKMGFRAKYFKAATEYLIQNNQDHKIELLDHDSIKKELISLNGVGDKIADCVMVFSLNADHITPLDVWGKRIVTDLYNLDSKMKYSDMSKWLTDYFGEHTSWAGQFLFEYLRNSKLNNLKK